MYVVHVYPRVLLGLYSVVSEMTDGEIIVTDRINQYTYYSFRSRPSPRFVKLRALSYFDPLGATVLLNGGVITHINRNG